MQSKQKLLQSPRLCMYLAIYHFYCTIFIFSHSIIAIILCFINFYISEVPHPVFLKSVKVCLFLKDFKEEDKVNKEIHRDLKMNVDKVLCSN